MPTAHPRHSGCGSPTSQTPDNDLGYGIVSGQDAVGLFCTCHDADADGFFDAACGGLDCDDASGAVHPGATEICSGRDDDCDGAMLSDEADDDGDGYPPCAGDCDDSEPAVSPGATEVCDDELDNDCNGAADLDDIACAPDPPPATPPAAADEDGGCGCRLGGPSPVPGGSLPWLTLLACGCLRRRRFPPRSAGRRHRQAIR